MNAPVDPELERTIARMYERFNAREIDAVIELMDAEVDWPNALEGTRISGHDAVRAYWRRQFAEFDPRVEPVGFEMLDDGRVRVLVGQGRVFHDYEFRDGLIARMDVVAAEGG